MRATLKRKGAIEAQWRITHLVHEPGGGLVALETLMSLNEETTELIRLLQRNDEDLVNLNGILKLILSHHEESNAKAEESRDELRKKMNLDTCFDLVTEGEGYSCDARSCVRLQSFQRSLVFGDVKERRKMMCQF